MRLRPAGPRVSIGQHSHKVKMHDKVTRVVVDRSLFLAKLASNGAYYYVTTKVIVRASDDSTKVQFLIATLAC